MSSSEPTPALVDAGVGGGDGDLPPPPSPLSLALVFSGFRCVLTYVCLPVLAPVLGAALVIAVPLVLALYAAGITASAVAMVRGARTGRWPAASLAAGLLLLNVASLLAVVTPRL